MPESLDRGTPEYPFRVNPAADHPQSDDVAQAIADALAEDDPAPNPWWQAGIDEALEE